MFVGLGFMVLALLDRMVVSPISSRINRSNQQVSLAEKQLGRHLRNLRQEQVISEEYRKYIKYVKKVGSDEEEVAGILGEIEELARKSAVYLVDIKPQMAKKVNFYKKYSVEVEAEGETESLVDFMYRLNNSPQLLRVAKLRFRLKEKESPIVKAVFIIVKVLVL